MKIKHYVLLIATSLGLATPLLHAQPAAHSSAAASQAKVQAAKAGMTFDEAEALLMQAQEGDVPALARLQAAGAQGNVHAQINLANIYFEGHGVKQNYAQAVEWFTKAAAQGDLEAQVYLGLMHAEGRGVAQSDAIALQWLDKASASINHGIERKLLLLITMYLADIPHSEIQPIYTWLAKAADKGPTWLQFVVANVLFDKQEPGSAVSVAALELFQRAAENGSAGAQFLLGVMYFEGKGMPKNDAEAFKWFRRAGEQDYPLAADVLSPMYHLGLGVARDDVESDKWAVRQSQSPSIVSVTLPIANKSIRKLAFKGHAFAQNSLAKDYANDEKNYALALKWFRRAADQGLADAQFHLGEIYQGGQGVTQDNTQALQWYRLAAVQGHSQAQYTLGMAYASGQGLARDDVQSYQWLTLAQKTAKAGDYFLPKKSLPVVLRMLEKRMRPEQTAQANKAVADWLAAHPASVQP